MWDFLSLSLKNLSRHKVRSILTLIGIATATALLFSVLSFNKGFEQGLQRELTRTGLHFMVVPSGCAHEVAALVLHGAVIPKFLDTTVLSHIKQTEGIELATPILVAQLPNHEKNKIDLIYGMDMSFVRKIKPSWDINGDVPKHEDEILLGFEVAEHYKLKVGDKIAYSKIGKDFTVKGIVGKTNSQDDAFIYLPIETAQTILKMPARATAIGVKVLKAEELSKITDDLSASVPGIQIVTMNQVMNSIANLAASAKALSLSFAIVAIVIASVGVMNALLTAVFERTEEIGMMRAIGATKPQVFIMIIYETVILTSLGAGLGIALSYIAKDLIETFIRQIIPYMPAGEVAVFEPLTALFCMLFSIAIGVVSGLMPAIRAARIQPVEAIKG